MKPDSVQRDRFDAYARDYQRLLDESVRISGYDPGYFDEYKIQEICGFLRPRGLDRGRLRFLDFGCGIGRSERPIRRQLPGAVVYAADPSRESIEMAKSSNKDLTNVFFSSMEDLQIPFDGEFDVILVANVLHHIERGDHVPVLRQLKSRLSADGHIFIFEHNPFNPLTVRVVRACPFDEDAVLLSPVYTRRILTEAGFAWSTVRFTLFFPRILSFLRPLEKWLRKLPMGAQYYFVAGRGAGR
jgi:SAM-dependent methyltransferase